MLARLFTSVCPLARIDVNFRTQLQLSGAFTRNVPLTHSVIAAYKIPFAVCSGVDLPLRGSLGYFSIKQYCSHIIALTTTTNPPAVAMSHP